MKRILSFILAAAMCFALAACGQREISDIVSDDIHIRIANETDSYGETWSGPQIDRVVENAAEPEAALPSFDPVGPWHLNREKTDLNAIESAWDIFPGYGEWGAGMELRSNGQMSWFIGAVGGSGTYGIKGDILHAELTDYMEQKALSMDFEITGTDELKMVFAGMEICWTYGDREDTPANGE